MSRAHGYDHNESASAGRRLSSAAHQVHRRRPVAVAVEQRAADAAVEDAVEGLMMRFGVPLADHLVAFLEAADSQALFVGRSAAETDAVRRISLLQ